MDLFYTDISHIHIKGGTVSGTSLTIVEQQELERIIDMEV